MSTYIFSFLNIYGTLYSEVINKMGLNDFIKIGDKLKNLRKEKGISQKDMAKLLNIPYSTYSNYENNNRTPSTDTLFQISKILKVDVSTLFVADIARNDYHEFLDLFLEWAESKGYDAQFSHDEKTYVENGGQSIYIKNNGLIYEFKVQELTDCYRILFNLFDLLLESKLTECRKDDSLDQNTPDTDSKE